MILQELLSSEPGQLIKGFESIRIDYIEGMGIKTVIKSPSFIGWNLPAQQTKQSFAFDFIKDFPCEEELKCVNRRFTSPEDCLTFLMDKKNIEHNSSVLEENKEYAQNYTIIRVTTDDALGMLIGDYFSAYPITTPTPDNFVCKLYAKAIIGDKIGWLTLSVLNEDYLEIS